MRLLKQYWHGLVLLLLCWLLQRQASDQQWVEQTYTSSIFLPLQEVLGTFFGLFPFSWGDLMYGLFILLLLGYLIFWVRKIKIVHREERKWLVIKFLYDFCCLSMAIYLIFNILWGNNYNRQPIAARLKLQVKPFSALTTSEIANLNWILLKKVNRYGGMLPLDQKRPTSSAEIFDKAYESYDRLSANVKFLRPVQHSLKPSLWGWLGNYIGFTGYYNPFTFEAQVNTDVPHFLQPYVACHEIAHQLGYAKEMEANFVGYLAASHSPDSYFRYSVYLDMFLYANGMLYTKDSLLANKVRSSLNSSVKRDLAEWREFRMRHRNAIEPYITKAYDFFLKRNNQPEGMGSYSMVTAFLLAYFEKYGDV